MKKIAKTISLLLVLAVLLSACNFSAQKATRLEILSDDYVTINPGETMILEIDSDYRGNVTWSSDDENVATVDSLGVVKGVSEGIAVIMVSGGGLFDMVSVKVSQSKTELTLTSSSKTVVVGQSVNLQVTVLPAELTEKVSLHIADGSAFATLSGKTLTGVAPGKVVVVASVDDVVAAETVTVVQSADVDKIVLTASAQTAKVGQSVNLLVEGVPSELIGGVKFNVVEGIGTVSNGKLTSTTVGEVTVCATYGSVQSNLVTVTFEQSDVLPQSITIVASNTSLYVGDKATLSYSSVPQGSATFIDYFVESGSNVVAISDGKIEATAVGTATIYGEFCGVRSNYLTITVLADQDPYLGVSQTSFYNNYREATSYKDSYYRSLHNFMSGSLDVPSKVPTNASNQPSYGGKLLKNTATVYGDNGNSYTVLDSNGNEAFTVYKGGAYVSLEQVAAYVKAFGNTPANYDSDTGNKNSSSDPWGKYLRLNHARFYGNVDKYPNEPLLPENNGYGGNKYYYEIDIGLSGYNNGKKITRGTARIVYARYKGGTYAQTTASERYVFYTYNHYEDFQEYLNYKGGWGKRFGYETSNYTSPTDYVQVNLYDFMGGTSQSAINAWFGKN